jgi:hypothetical protein
LLLFQHTGTHNDVTGGFKYFPAQRKLMLAPLSPEFWRVYNYVARQWYETEYGVVAVPERWYHPAMLQLEDFAYEHRKNGAGR